MKNKLKGLTLIETVLYIGLFSIILLMVVSFMLSTQQSTEKTNSSEDLFKSSQFIIQHINHTFENSYSVDEANSSFEVDSGILSLEFESVNKTYQIQDQQLYFDGVAISPPDIIVERFFLTPIYKETDITAVRFEILLRDKKNTDYMEEINLLSTFR
jgi:Tfp pilus assembly protein FimT